MVDRKPRIAMLLSVERLQGSVEEVYLVFHCVEGKVCVWFNVRRTVSEAITAITDHRTKGVYIHLQILNTKNRAIIRTTRGQGVRNE